jgi:hypothetical protein
MSTCRQYRLILVHLKEGGTINRDECEVPKFGNCRRLAARIGEMKAAGHDIARVWVVGKTGTKIVQYSMQKEAENA